MKFSITGTDIDFNFNTGYYIIEVTTWAGLTVYNQEVTFGTKKRWP